MIYFTIGVVKNYLKYDSIYFGNNSIYLGKHSFEFVSFYYSHNHAVFSVQRVL